MKKLKHSTEDGHDVAAAPLPSFLWSREGDEEPRALCREGPHVKFGIFYEQQLPRPGAVDGASTSSMKDLRWRRSSWPIGSATTTRVGVVEHHFLEEYSYCSAAEAASSAPPPSDACIRLGHGVVQLPTTIRSAWPSRGRAGPPLRRPVWSSACARPGAGGLRVIHLAPASGGHGTWEEAVRALIPMLAGNRSSGTGSISTSPRATLIPKPFQKPHPPLWVACSNITTMADTALGMGALFVSAEAAPHLVTEYYGTSRSGPSVSPIIGPIRTSRWSAASCAPRR